MADCMVLGGGVIGLSIAYELACHGRSVLLVDRGEVGREASWAGAGILPAPATRSDVPAWKQLQSMSYRLHEDWSARLKDETGVDNGYQRCGGIHLARQLGEAAALRADMAEWVDDGVDVRRLETGGDLQQLEPQFAASLTDGSLAAFHVPDEAQIRNPRHLQALLSACRNRNVQIIEQKEITDFVIHEDRVVAGVAGGESFSAESYVVAAGAWSENLLKPLGLTLSIYPVRGQMLLLECQERRITHIVNEGPRYIVPRADNFVLVGSTEEDVGFDKQTTESGLADLREFAGQLFPCVKDAHVAKSWAGLRPHAVDGFPYMGRVPHLSNCYVAAGHYRAGLSTSPGTALLMRQLIDGKPTELDISEFRLDR